MGLSYHIFRHYFPEFVAAKSIRRFPSTSGIVLMYHEVLPDYISLPAWTILRESAFRWQMTYLSTHFDVISIDHALERVAGKHDAKRPFAVVTFDDGYQGNFSTVLPIMEAMGLQFTVYCATKAIVEKRQYWYDRIIDLLHIHDHVHVTLVLNAQPQHFTIPRSGENRRWIKVQKILNHLKLMPPEDREEAVTNIASKFGRTKSPLKMLSEDELRRLAASTCVTIGCHTHGHELLDQLGTREINETLSLANEHIRRITGTYPRHFAYPNGNYNKSVLDVVRRSGFVTAVSTSPGFWSGMPCIMQIPRIGIGRFDTKGCFMARVSGYL
jgi:peptidoglycan/xylan/chitin deacetylase (PgdA/CDA1 family)